MMVLRKKRIIPFVLFFLIIAAGVINLRYLETVPREGTELAAGSDPKLVEATEDAVAVSATEPETQEVMAPDYFTSAKADREASRAQSAETLKALLENDSATPDAKQQAEAELTALAVRNEQETAIESQILAKGYTNAVAYITAESVSVIVESQGLTAADAAILQEIAVTQTGCAPEAVRIVEVH